MSANADVSIAAVMGEGFAIHPGEKMKKMERRKRPQVAFEWKITPAPNDLAERVKVWRIKACGGKNNFYIREREYYMFLQKYELQNPSEGKREFLSKGKLRLETEEGTDPRTHIPASSGEQSASHGQPGPGPQQAIYQQGKRPSWEMGGQEFSPSLKRRSTGSQTWGSSSQSSLSSPEVSRPPSVADPRQTIMGPPRLGSSDRPMRQTWSWRGSRGSIGSRTARVTSGMAGLTVQSPSWGSPEGVAPPSEGSPWGAPQAMAGSTFGQPGGGYGHYSQDYVRPSPAYGQPTEVYGHPGQDLQGPPVRPFQVGIAHTQIPGGEWPPPQPWRQQQLLVEQGHLQHSQQPGQRAGFGQWPHGSGYNLPRPGPDVQTGGNYAPSFPPAQPVMHGGGDRSLQQPHHMAVGPPMRRIHQSSLQNMPMTESPQLQGLAAASIPSSFPPNPPSPMTQSLPPPSVSGIDPAQFQAVTTCPPVGHSYPSSRPPTTRSTPAELIDPPEPEDLSADSESYSESESDSEDGQDPYQATQPSQPFLDDGRFYQSPEPAQQSRSGYEDPYWGANDSAEE